MAHHLSALKRHRQNLKRKSRNRQAKSKIKTNIKRLLKLVEENNAEKALEALRETTAVLDRAGRKGVIKKKNASRKVSQLAKKVNSLKK